MAVLPVSSRTFGSAPCASSASTMRSLPLKAAAISGVTPLRPGRFGSAPLASNKATVECFSASAAANSAVPPSTLRASIGAPLARKSSTSLIWPPRAACASGIGAAAVARQQRSAGIEELARQSLAASVGGREQRHIDLHRDGLGFDELVVALDLTAVPLGARLQVLRARRRECGEHDGEGRAGDGAERAAEHRVRPFNSGCFAARR